jgi:hypothetical protein
MCQENAGNSADECLPYSLSAIFSTGAFCRMHFRLPLMTKFSAVTTKMCEIVGSKNLSKRIKNLDAFKSYSRKNEEGGSTLCARVLIKAVSINIDINIGYRDICCQNIEYRIEIEKANRSITSLWDE